MKKGPAGLMHRNRGRESRRQTPQAEIDKGLWSPKKKRYLVVHQQRRRRDREGELVQIDGSPHNWFENRGPYCTLLVFVDDATGKLKHLMFAGAETTNNYFKATYAYIRKFGKPIAIYIDRYSTYKINHKAAVDNSELVTQFGRAMKSLSIELILPTHHRQKAELSGFSKP